MAFTATINSIDYKDSKFVVEVSFDDSVTGFQKSRTYYFSNGTARAAALATITADGTVLKADLASRSAVLTTLQSDVGTVIVI